MPIKNIISVKSIATMGVCLCLALILSYIESLIPFNIGIPGVKLGLANSAIVFVLYYVGIIPGIIVSILRVLLSGFIFGNLYSIIYSLFGALLSILVMILVKSILKLSAISASVAGGIFHNIGQLIAAALMVSTYQILYYVPVLLLAGAITGGLIGVVVYIILNRIKDL